MGQTFWQRLHFICFLLVAFKYYSSFGYLMPGSRPDHGRYIYLYCSSQDQKKKFQELADQADTPLSKFLLNIIEEGVSQHQARPRIKITESMKGMEEELARLREEAKTNEKLLKRYEAENRRLREAAKFADDFDGERRLDQELIATLQRGPAHDYRLLEILGIDPRDSVQVAAVQKQLQVLEFHGLISKGARGWQWQKK
jgi:hypothetical protein